MSATILAATASLWPREPVRESRQARRYRKRLEAKRTSGATLADDPFWLMCRCDDDNGSGSWAISGVNDPADGDATARAFQQLAAQVGPLTTRCELIPNDEAAFVAWTKRVGLGKRARVRR